MDADHALDVLATGLRERLVAEAEEAVEAARAEADRAVTAAAAEVGRAQARVEEVEAALESSRRAVREGRSLEDTRVRLLLDTVVEASSSLRRELALPPVQTRPADLVDAAEPGERITASERALLSDDPALLAYLGRQRIASLDNIGSAAKFVRVAEGRADLYPRLGPTMEWDTAAPQAVVEAAGGSVTLFDGSPLLYGKPGWRNPHFICRGAITPDA